MDKIYDAIVIGAGHAGAEAAHALAKLNKKTLLLSLSLDAISFMACNPNVGGTGKGHLVKEIDALGGIMGIIADKATLQTRMLNLGNGPAVHSLRSQVDKQLYHRLVKAELERTENLTILQGEAVEIITEQGEVRGIRTSLNDVISARAIVIATGVYLDSRIIIGDFTAETGPNGFMRAKGLTESLLSLGLSIRRFKTGTPPRIAKEGVDFSRMEAQSGDVGYPSFSFMTTENVRNDYVCYLTYTNPTTHKIILDNLDRSPLYNGSISGVGPRYCPSVETKIVRFKDKERHQIFVEPEGGDTDELYVQGLSTSMPYDVQEKMLNSIVGLENAKITRYGYAIEYDCLNPIELYPSLEIKKVKGLFAAGQINGSSGYEEAAAQGIVAGINAARFLEGKPSIILKRSEAYIGVLIDDLVTKGTNEPYRMMTSRAEHRLFLRQDNADERLTPLGKKIGLVDEARFEKFVKDRETREELKERLKTTYSPERSAALCEAAGETEPKSGVRASDLLKRGGISAELMVKYLPEFKNADIEALRRIEVELKYAGYLEKEEKAVKEAIRLEKTALSPDIDYGSIIGLRVEARQKLDEIKPLSLAQASRISGVTPADITVLIIYLSKNAR